MDEQNQQQRSDMNDDDFAEVMNESSELSAPVSSDRAERFYDRMRDRIRKYLEEKGSLAGKAGEFLLLAPDVFVLLWRLIQDPRVDKKHKVSLGSGLAYFLFPLDITPEAFFGPIGYVDDLIFGVLLLKRMLVDTDEEILREHWAGSDDVRAMIEKVLSAAEQLVGSELLGRFKKAAK